MGITFLSVQLLLCCILAKELESDKWSQKCWLISYGAPSLNTASQTLLSINLALRIINNQKKWYIYRPFPNFHLLWVQTLVPSLSFSCIFLALAPKWQLCIYDLCFPALGFSKKILGLNLGCKTPDSNKCS